MIIATIYFVLARCKDHVNKHFACVLSLHFHDRLMKQMLLALFSPLKGTERLNSTPNHLTNQNRNQLWSQDCLTQNLSSHVTRSHVSGCSLTPLSRCDNDAVSWPCFSRKTTIFHKCNLFVSWVIFPCEEVLDLSCQCENWGTWSCLHPSWLCNQPRKTHEFQFCGRYSPPKIKLYCSLAVVIVCFFINIK